MGKKYYLEPDSTREKVCLIMKNGNKAQYTIKELHEIFKEKHGEISYVSIIKALSPLIEQGFLKKTKENRTEGKVSLISFNSELKSITGKDLAELGEAMLESSITLLYSIPGDSKERIQDLEKKWKAQVEKIRKSANMTWLLEK